MIQGIFSILLFLLVAGLVAVAFVAAVVLRAVHKAKDALGGKNSTTGRTTTGRTTTNGTGRTHFHFTVRNQGNGPSIIDTRPDDVAQRKIFSKDEGEYVDFTEQ